MSAGTGAHGGNGSPINLVLSRLHNARRSGDSWMALCPGHKDRTPSLHVSLGNDGRVLLKCFAGCPLDNILAALELKASDLFLPHGNGHTKLYTEKTVGVYNYLDRDGTLLYQVIRKQPKKFLQRKPNGSGDWLYEVGDVARVLYRLPELLSADPEVAVFVCEGEKDVDRLYELGLVATTNVGGAGKWKAAYAEDLRDRTVVILQDNDTPGEAHAEDVRASLFKIARQVHVVRLPDLPPKGDVSDWLDAGNGLADLLERVRQGSDTSTEAVEEELAPDERWEPVPISALTDVTEEICWQWHGFLATGNTTIFTGLWKSGKSTLLAYLLRALDGTHLAFGGQVVTTAKALVVSEENPRHWITRRRELEIDDHVHLICRPFLKRADQRTWETFLEWLAKKVKRNGYTLLVIDSLHNLWPVKNENDSADANNALMPLQAITEMGCAVLLLGHPSKGDATEGRATRGSGATAAFADIVVEMRRFDPEHREDTRRVLTTYSRFEETPVDLVLQYTPGHGYDAVGTRSEAKTNGRMEMLLGLLPKDPPGMTPEHVRAEWPDGQMRPAKRTIERDLTIAHEAGKVKRTGTGKPFDPFRYCRDSG